MNTRVLLAVLLGFLGYFFSGWGIYAGFINQQMVYPDGIKEVIMRPEAEFNMAYMAISCLLWAVLIVYILVKMNVTDWNNGAITALTIGAVTAICTGLSYASQFTPGSLHNTMMDALGNGITSAVAGGLAGWWLGRK